MGKPINITVLINKLMTTDNHLKNIIYDRELYEKSLET